MGLCSAQHGAWYSEWKLFLFHEGSFLFFPPICYPFGEVTKGSCSAFYTRGHEAWGNGMLW